MRNKYTVRVVKCTFNQLPYLTIPRLHSIQVTPLSLFDILFLLFHVHPEKLEKRAFDLVSNAYTSIRAEDLARLMGVTTEAAVSGE